MKKRIKILCLATVLVFALAGVSLADSITYPYSKTYEYYNPSGVLGAKVYLWIEMQGDLYKYIYQVENVFFDADNNDVADEAIFGFVLPITALTIPPEDYGVIPDTGEVEVNLSLGSEGGRDVMYAEFALYSIALLGVGNFDLSQQFYLLSTHAPDLGNAVLTDGVSANILVLSNLFGQGDQNDTNPVPEPATLLLLGMGALGLEGFRRLKSRRA